MKISGPGRLSVLVLAGILGACSSTGDSPKDSSPIDTRVDSPVMMKEASIDLSRDISTLDTTTDKAVPVDLAMADSGPCKPGEFVLKVGTTPKCIPLPTGVTLPVDSSQEADAVKKAANCTCKCENGWTKNKTKWKCYCCTKYPDCLVEIDEATAATRCELYG